jgi:hypothetical protein
MKKLFFAFSLFCSHSLIFSAQEAEQAPQTGSGVPAVQATPELDQKTVNQKPSSPFKPDFDFYMGLDEGLIEAADFTPRLVPRWRLREAELLRAWLTQAKGKL